MAESSRNLGTVAPSGLRFPAERWAGGSLIIEVSGRRRAVAILLVLRAVVGMVGIIF